MAGVNLFDFFFLVPHFFALNLVQLFKLIVLLFQSFEVVADRLYFKVLHSQKVFLV
jgi:hypothetical protein